MVFHSAAQGQFLERSEIGALLSAEKLPIPQTKDQMIQYDSMV